MEIQGPFESADSELTFTPRRHCLDTRFWAQANESFFVSACLYGDKAASVAALSLDGRIVFRTRLPDRGHDVAVRPDAPDLVVVARRPAIGP